MKSPNPKVNPILFPVIVILVFVFSIIGHQIEMAHTGHHFHLLGVIYATICFFLMHHVDPIPPNNYILFAQYLAALLICTSIFALVFERLKKAYLINRIKLTYKNHIVIFTLSHIGKTIALELLDKGYKVIVIETDEKNPFIEQVKKKGGFVFTEKPSDFKTLDMTGVGNCRVCLLTSDNDEVNIETASTIGSYLLTNSSKGKTDPHKIMVHINNAANENIIKDYFDIHNEDDHYDLETFTVSESAAKKIYDLYPPHKYINLADKESENAIAIIGYSNVAEAFIIENIILSHYPDMDKLKIYLVDEHADLHFNHLNFKYPFYHEFVEIIPVKLLNGSFFANFAWSKNHIEKLSKVKVAYVFGNNDSALITTAANFRQFLYTQTLAITQVPIIACLPEDTGILNLLNINKHKSQTLSQEFSSKLNIKTYRLISNTCTADGLIEENEHTHKLSKLINFFYSIKYEFASELTQKFNVQNANKIAAKLEDCLLALPEQHTSMNEKEIEKYLLEILQKDTGISYTELYKNFSIDKRWSLLSYRKKDSNKYASRQVAQKINTLKHIGCWPMTKQNITNFYPRVAPLEHTRWNAEKMVFNYKYGPFPTDKKEKHLLKEVLKIHDQLVPYEKLSEDDKQKDLNIFLMVPVLNIIKPIAE